MVLRISFRGVGGGVAPPLPLRTATIHMHNVYAHIEISPVLMAKLTNKMSLAALRVGDDNLSFTFTLGDKHPCYVWPKLKYYLLSSKRYMYM